MSHFDLYKRTKEVVDSNALLFILVAVAVVAGPAALRWTAY